MIDGRCVFPYTDPKPPRGVHVSALPTMAQLQSLQIDMLFKAEPVLDNLPAPPKKAKPEVAVSASKVDQFLTEKKFSGNVTESEKARLRLFEQFLVEKGLMK